MRSSIFCILFACMAAILPWHASAVEKSETKVKATAEISKPGSDGKRLVTITLNVEKGWYIYANPINANSDIFDGNQTRVALKAGGKVTASVKYPAGKLKVNDKYKYDIYEGRVVIQASIERVAGDDSPLQISILVNACSKNDCLEPGTIKLTLP